MNDIAWMFIMFLLGTSFGLALAEVFAYLSYRARYSSKTKKKKQDAVQPLLGVVLPPEEKK